jgi:hypothetical protein
MNMMYKDWVNINPTPFTVDLEEVLELPTGKERMKIEKISKNVIETLIYRS